MKNFKRTLALVLSVIMLVGMMAIGAGAAFTDEAEIDYAEAAAVMNMAGIIKGYPDGSFGPDATLTRAEAAVMIARLLGFEDAAGSCTFTDVKGNAAYAWAEGAIALCEVEGIVAGNGDGTFGPDDKLTGYAWAKMLLCAVGYNAAAEGMIGETWDNGVYKLVKSTEIAKKIAGFDGSAEITRDAAAQMAFAAAQLPTQKWVKGTTISGTGLTIDVGGSYAAPGATLFAQLGVKKNDAAVEDDFDRPVTTWYVDADSDNVQDATEKKAVVAKEAAATYVVTKNNTAMSAILKALDLTAESTVVGTYNIGDVVELYNTDTDAKIDVAVATTEMLYQISKVVEAAEDAKYDYTVTFKAVANGNASGTKVYNDNKLEGFDAATMKKGAYVLLTEGTETAVVTVPAVAEGKVNAVGTGYFKLDGEKNSYAYGVTPLAVSNTTTYKVFTNSNGYVVGYAAVAATETVASKVFYVEEDNFVAGGTFSGDKAQLSVMNPDGSKAIVEVEIYTKSGAKYVKIGGADVALGSAAAPAGFYAYTADDAGVITSLTAITAAGVDTDGDKKVDTAIAATDVDFDVKAALVKIDTSKNFYATADTTVTTIKAGKATTVTGYSNFVNETYAIDNGTPLDTTDDLAILYVFSGTTLNQVYVLGADSMTAAPQAVYGVYVSTGDTYKDAKNNDVTDVVYNVAGVDTTYTISGTSVADTYKGIVTIEVSNGIATLTAYTSNADKVVASVYADYVVFGDAATPVYFASGVKFYDITDVAKNGVVELDELAKNDIVTYVTGTGANAGKITAAYVTYAAQEDGVITNNNAVYAEKVLGFSAGDAATIEALGEDGIIIQVASVAKVKAADGKYDLSITLYEDGVVVYTADHNDLVKGSAIMIDVTGESGTVVYEIADLNDSGAVIATGSFVID